MTGEITREYLNSIGFRIDDAKKQNVFKAFAWTRTHEGNDYWDNFMGTWHSEGRSKIDEMIRVWEGKEPNPEPVANQELLAAAKFALEHAVADDMDEWYRRLKLAVVAAGA